MSSPHLPDKKMKVKTSQVNFVILAIYRYTVRRDGTRMPVGRRQVAGCDVLDNVLLRDLRPGIYVLITLTHAIYLNIAADQIHFFMAMVVPNDSGLFKHNNTK